MEKSGHALQKEGIW